jgi:hypothetical protein
MNEQLLREYIKEHVRNLLEKVGEQLKIGNNDVELIYKDDDQDEEGAISTAVYKVNNKFLITFQTYGGRGIDEKFYYHIPDKGDAKDVGIDNSLDLANGVTDEVKTVITKNFIEKLAEDALYQMSTPFKFNSVDVIPGRWSDFF